MALTDTKLRALRPRDAVYRVADANGLAIEVRPTGSRLWRYRYRFAGKASMLALGEYPAVSLADARTARDEARRLLDKGINPSQARRADERERRASARNTFKTVALEWIDRMGGMWTAHHSADVWRSLEQEAFPAIGSRPVSEVTPSEVIDCLRKIEARGAIEVAHRTAQRIASVFRYAVNTNRATFNPAADLRGVLKTRKVTHLAAMPREELPDFLRKLETYDGRPETRIGLRLLALTFVRTGELRGAYWTEIDFNKAEWRVPAERMKMREEHVVPLSVQAIAALRELQAFTGRAPLLFPGRSNAHKPVSENTFLFALYRLGYHGRATGHGFRALASTTLNEQGWPPDVIERQLAHAERNKVRAAYNRAQHLPERRKMMQAWADYLDSLRTAKNVVPIKRRAG
ncbi:MAG TPA: integrase arm-type DNA-binding domain-containing protein [Dokdonella sp.]